MTAREKQRAIRRVEKLLKAPEARVTYIDRCDAFRHVGDWLGVPELSGGPWTRYIVVAVGPERIEEDRFVRG